MTITSYSMSTTEDVDCSDDKAECPEGTDGAGEGFAYSEDDSGGCYADYESNCCSKQCGTEIIYGTLGKEYSTTNTVIYSCSYDRDCDSDGLCLYIVS